MVRLGSDDRRITPRRLEARVRGAASAALAEREEEELAADEGADERERGGGGEDGAELRLRKVG